MPFAWFVALRYLWDSRGMTLLILSAVSIGVSVVVFLSALISGLQTSLLDKTLGTQPHITLHTPREVPRSFASSTSDRGVARNVQAVAQRLRSIDQWPRVVKEVSKIREITAVSPTIVGAGFAARADATLPIVLRGVDPERFVAVIDVRKRMTEGTFDIAGDSVAIGATLAGDLGVHVGDKLRISSSERRSDVVSVSGIFSLGNAAFDKTSVLTSLRHAQALFALPGGATSIELKVDDVFQAEALAKIIAGRTGLDADSWMKLNAELLSGLSAQSSSKTMIQFFVVLAVALGIASVLIVSVVQKSREIGILRAVGTQPQRVLMVFLIQGGVLGFIGSIFGSVLGVIFAKLFEGMAIGPDGRPRFAVELSPSLFIAATVMATGVGLLAAAIPARRAARLDPATAIRGG
ncbi:MAG TPA: ABC transporter permease [Polyangiales bacterium]|nr:ABC transporter permease [Polyangiales bacterium]